MSPNPIFTYAEPSSTEITARRIEDLEDQCAELQRQNKLLRTENESLRSNMPKEHPNNFKTFIVEKEGNRERYACLREEFSRSEEFTVYAVSNFVSTKQFEVSSMPVGTFDPLTGKITLDYTSDISKYRTLVANGERYACLREEFSRTENFHIYGVRDFVDSNHFKVTSKPIGTLCYDN